MSISAEEFASLQTQLVELKTYKYEGQELQRKLQNGIYYLFTYFFPVLKSILH